MHERIKRNEEKRKIELKWDEQIKRKNMKEWKNKMKGEKDVEYKKSEREKQFISIPIHSMKEKR